MKIAHLRLSITTVVAAAGTAAIVGSGTALAAPHRHIPPSAPTASTTVVIRNFAFHPAIVTIHRGTSVHWINRDSMTHTTTSDTGLWTKTLSPGSGFTFTFRKAGSYRYHCAIHPSMTGIVKVT